MYTHTEVYINNVNYIDSHKCRYCYSIVCCITV